MRVYRPIFPNHPIPTRKRLIVSKVLEIGQSDLLRFAPAQSIVDHPRYGHVVVVASLDRGELAGFAGFPPGVYVHIIDQSRTCPVYANTPVTRLS